MVPPPSTFAELNVLIEIERVIRWSSAEAGTPYRHHLERPLVKHKSPPLEQHWCDHCVGFFGARHGAMHDAGLCRHVVSALNHRRQCACVDCVVAEDLAEAHHD
jgi:hypothetical protein